MENNQLSKISKIFIKTRCKTLRANLGKSYPNENRVTPKVKKSLTSQIIKMETWHYKSPVLALIVYFSISLIEVV